MRTATAGELTQLAANQRSSHVRVFVDRSGSGTFVDLTNVNSIDWVDQVEIRDSVDDPGSNATVVLKREAGGDSCAALMEGAAFNNLPGVYVATIDAGREFYIEAAVVAALTTPSAGDWKELFRGRIDEVEFGSSGELRFTGRDQSGDLATTWIENTSWRGTTEGQDVEDVINDILGDWTSESVSTPTSPGFAIVRYQQRKESVAAAIEALVGCIGWLIRYKWNGSAWVYTLFDPDRTKTTPDHTFSSSAYDDITRLAISRRGVRNVIKVIYTDASTDLRQEYVASDAASITRFGRQYMEISESETSQINSATEAQTMADAILADLADPAADLEMVLPLFWPVEITDLYRISANGVHFDTDQDLAVVAWAHTFNASGATTQLTLRGAPSGGYRRWLNIGAEVFPRLSIDAVKAQNVEPNSRGLDNLIPNGEFLSTSSQTNVPPDGWEDDEHAWFFAHGFDDARSWGSGIAQEATIVDSGRSAITANVAATGGDDCIAVLSSRPFPITPGYYEIGTAFYIDESSVTDPILLRPTLAIRAYLAGLDQDLSTIDDPTTAVLFYAYGFYDNAGGTRPATPSGPSGGLNLSNGWKYARAVLRVEGASGVSTPIDYDVIVDRVWVRRVRQWELAKISGTMASGASFSAPSSMVISSGPYKTSTERLDSSALQAWKTISFCRAVNGPSDTVAHGIYANKHYPLRDGRYRVRCNVALDAMSAGKTLEVCARVSGGAAYGTVTKTTASGTNVIALDTEVSVVYGDYIEIGIKHNDTASRALNTSADLNNALFEELA